MKNLKDTILEKLIITKNSKLNKYTYYPKDWHELREILKERLAQDKNADLNDIDISNITSMWNFKKNKGIFEDLDPHNIHIEDWDVSKVKDMRDMFKWCENFNCDLSKWDVSGVESMHSMFIHCENFNCDLSKWDVSGVKFMDCMFRECINFEGKGLEKWHIGDVRNMSNMFSGCKSLINKPTWYK